MSERFIWKMKVSIFSFVVVVFFSFSLVNNAQAAEECTCQLNLTNTLNDTSDNVNFVINSDGLVGLPEEPMVDIPTSTISSTLHSQILPLYESSNQVCSTINNLSFTAGNPYSDTVFLVDCVINDSNGETSNSGGSSGGSSGESSNSIGESNACFCYPVDESGTRGSVSENVSNKISEEMCRNMGSSTTTIDGKKYEGCTWSQSGSSDEGAGDDQFNDTLEWADGSSSGRPTYIYLENPIDTDFVPILFGNVIATVMGLVGSIALIVFMYGGFMWLTAAGNPEHVKKGTQAMVWAGIGLFIIFSSYAIIYVILQGLGVV